MARLEALIQPIPGDPQQDLALERLAERLAGGFFGVDARNAAITLTASPGDLPVQVLLEWRPPDQPVVLLKSRERTGSGACPRAGLEATQKLSKTIATTEPPAATSRALAMRRAFDEGRGSVNSW